MTKKTSHILLNTKRLIAGALLCAVMGIMTILPAGMLFAGISSYSFSQVPQQYTELSNPTVVLFGNQDDVMTQVIDIGFDFVYDDMVYDQFKINSNGFITLDPESSTSYMNTLYYSPMIMAGFWDDLQTNGDSGNISYQISGTAPNRTLTVQFKNMNWYYSEPNNLVSFQICLDETSNTIRYVYGAMGNAPGDYGSAAIGLSGMYEGDYISVVPGYPSATASSTLEFISINGSHVQYLTGVSYVFSPPAPPTNDLQALSLMGDSTPEQWASTPYTFRIRNRGSQAQTDYTLRIMQGTTQLVSQPGTAIQAGEIVEFDLLCVFTTPGPTDIYGEIVFNADQNVSNNLTHLFNVTVQAPGTQTVTIGTGDVQSRIPMDFYWKNNLFECIYLASEINLTGLITGLELFNDFEDDFSQGKPTRIWLGETNEPDLSNGWIPSSQLTQVYDDLVSYPFGTNNILITLSTAYAYMGGNLIVLVQRPMDSEFYGASNFFDCQYIEGSARSLKVWSDSYLFDPAAPPQSTASGIFPKITIYAVTQGTGSLSGTVSHQGQALQGAEIRIIGTNLSTTSQAGGSYSFPYVSQDSYQVTCSMFGYLDQTLNTAVTQGLETDLDFQLQVYPSVNVMGRVTGSAAPDQGVPGVSVNLFGIQNYSAHTDPQGYFVFQNVFSGYEYSYIMAMTGFDTVYGSVIIGITDHDMGTTEMQERANPPVMVLAEETGLHVGVYWTAPNPNAAEVTESFESGTFPPANWSQIVTNHGSPNSYGVLPTWTRVSSIPTMGIGEPIHGNWQSAIWWADTHQDEWLITPQFVCPAEAILMFNGFIYLGPSNSGLDEHIYVKLSLDNGASWSVIWDSVTAGDGVFSDYNTPIVVSLEDYVYQSIKLAWHADDPPDNSGLWNIAVIDNISIGSPSNVIRLGADELRSVSFSGKIQGDHNRYVTNPPALSKGLAQNRQFSTSSHSHSILSVKNRQLLGYKVWRLLDGQEDDDTAWTALTQDPVSFTNFQDEDWSYLLGGSYKWAVKAVYSNGIISSAAFSNAVLHQQQPSGYISGVVISGIQPVGGALICAGVFSTTTLANGYYSIPVTVGTYTVSCSAPGYAVAANENIVVLQDQTTVCNFNLTVDASDELSQARTQLLGNYPNPFNPHTIIHFILKEHQRVRIDIFNSRGQLVRALLDEGRERGPQTAFWDGRDMKGRQVASGTYYYRMQCLDYNATRRMMLCK